MPAAYVAQKRMKVGHEYRYFGDPVPEAAEWRPMLVLAYEREGWLRRIDSGSGEYQEALAQLEARLEEERAAGDDAPDAPLAETADAEDSGTASSNEPPAPKPKRKARS